MTDLRRLCDDLRAFAEGCGVIHALGRTSPSLALGLYARVMERRDGEAEKLAALVGERATAGNNAASNGRRRPLATEAGL